MKTLKILFLLSSFLVFSCNNDSEDVPKKEENTQTSQDYTLADELFENVSDVADQAEKENEDYLGGGKTGEGYLSSCATISFDTAISSSTNKITIDFGSVGCKGKDGRVRKGKVIISYTGRYRDSSTVITSTFEDYFVNDHQLLGVRIVTNKGRNTIGQTHFEIQVDGSVIKANNGGTVKYTSSRVRTWVEGENTTGILAWLDDVYEITGTASGTNSDDLDYEVEITSPLVVKLNCKWIVEGKFEIRPDGLAIRYFDFGNGECDAKANLQINSFSIDFIMS